ncbi:Oidioi.mRNA.OKI2018_I69.chr1.g3382.t1.cds [Oikopleura dioica]|uniref:Oidioi.mRNA.OKI2018_I69.chr1.g3382.t1.cds n=1 Tax=Oikopleura dioica TaxID=34765 RepID=A0ABN7SZF2_OIKDI|nr:Oidioi.mRNA.OKI2018_I69.chr1.g3382.t1.cds [Oikopleura dioica]
MFQNVNNINCIFALASLLFASVSCQEASKEPILPFFTLFHPEVNTYPLFGTEKIWILRREWPEKWTLDIEIEPDNTRHRKSGLFRIKKQSRTQEFIYSLDWNFSRQKTVLYVDDRRIVFSKAPRKFFIAFSGDSAFLYYGCAKALKGTVFGDAPLKSPIFDEAHLEIGSGQAKNTEFHGKIHKFSFYDSAEIAFNLAKERFWDGGNNILHDRPFVDTFL